ncbi:hypothetical protein ON010_g18484 [Phytophthora cinnamomi]|nr:hypothetical protein ON010_g18484 [Phytophthora cinnamomi]
MEDTAALLSSSDRAGRAGDPAAAAVARGRGDAALVPEAAVAQPRGAPRGQQAARAGEGGGRGGGGLGRAGRGRRAGQTQGVYGPQELAHQGAGKRTGRLAGCRVGTDVAAAVGAESACAVEVLGAT